VNSVKIDFTGYDRKKDRYVLYLVEEGPWDEESYYQRLKEIQERIYNVVDSVIDGHLSSEFQLVKNANILIQVDCYDPPNENIGKLVTGIYEYISDSNEYQKAIIESEFISRIRIEYHEDELE
jgi:hypothetical protein